MFEDIFGPENWSRILILEAESPISKMRLEKYLLDTYASREMSFRSYDNMTFTIKTTCREQSQAYLNLEELNGLKIKVNPHARLNCIQGTAILPNDFEPCMDKKILLESLQSRYRNIENLEIYEIKNRKYSSRNMQIAKISFSGSELPNRILIMGQNREIRPYISKPLQCRKCSKFGHSETKCRNEEICAYCSSKQHEKMDHLNVLIVMTIIMQEQKHALSMYITLNLNF